jgi:hypothetical protein
MSSLTPFRVLRFVALALLLPVFAGSLPAQDLILKQTVKSSGAMMMGGMDRNSMTTTYFTARAMKVESANEPSTIILFDDQKLITVDHRKKTYSEITFRQLEESMNTLVAEMEKNKEQYEAMRRMMGGSAESFTVEKAGPGDVIAGYKTEKYLLKGPYEMQIWAAPDLKVPALYYDAMKMRMPRNPIFDFSKIFDEMKKIQGMTLKTVQVINMMGRKMETTTEVTSVEKGPVPADIFKIPAGYTMDQMNAPMQMPKSAPGRPGKP